MTPILVFTKESLYLRRLLLITTLSLLSVLTYGRASSQVSFTVTMENPANQTFHVVMKFSSEHPDAMTLKMPNWSPGYYQLMNYADAVSGFIAKDGSGKQLVSGRAGKNAWTIEYLKTDEVTVEYDVKAVKPFVANSLLDQEHGYIVPTGLFLYPEGGIARGARVTIIPPEDWADVATGLDAIPESKHVFEAPDFDVLYDSPILIGNLEELPAFEVNGIPHRFIGFKMGD
ncbi:MAG TPA: hypothetical protein VGN64_03925, partial [Dyadobacter sp.]|nr:hypothetical protein [Dyadobacter sp.]